MSNSEDALSSTPMVSRSTIGADLQDPLDDRQHLSPHVGRQLRPCLDNSGQFRVTICADCTGLCTAYRADTHLFQGFTRLFESCIAHSSDKAGGLFRFVQPAIELVGEGLPVSRSEVCRAARDQTLAAQSV
jgi:hypothetical protein